MGWTCWYPHKMPHVLIHIYQLTNLGMQNLGTSQESSRSTWGLSRPNNWKHHWYHNWSCEILENRKWFSPRTILPNYHHMNPNWYHTAYSYWKYFTPQRYPPYRKSPDLTVRPQENPRRFSHDRKKVIVSNLQLILLKKYKIGSLSTLGFHKLNKI